MDSNLRSLSPASKIAEFDTCVCLHIRPLCLCLRSATPATPSGEGRGNPASSGGSANRSVERRHHGHRAVYNLNTRCMATRLLYDVCISTVTSKYTDMICLRLNQLSEGELQKMWIREKKIFANEFLTDQVLLSVNVEYTETSLDISQKISFWNREQMCCFLFYTEILS